MKARKLIFVDGAKTRAAVKQINGKGGMAELCKQKGVSQPVLSDICINGYGTEKTIRKYMAAGIPIIISDRPVPNRTKRPFTRGQKTEAEKPVKEYFKLGEELIEIDAGDIQKKVERHQPKQISFEDFTGETKVKQMKDIIIKGLTNIINELNKI